MRQPSAPARNFAHMIVEWAARWRPQSVPAMTFSLPQTLAQRSSYDIAKDRFRFPYA